MLTLAQGCTALMLYGVDAVVMVTVAISQKDLWRKKDNEQPPAGLYVLQYVHISSYMDMHDRCDTYIGELVIKGSARIL